MPGHLIKVWQDKQRHNFYSFLEDLSVVFIQAELPLQREVSWAQTARSNFQHLSFHYAQFFFLLSVHIKRSQSPLQHCQKHESRQHEQILYSIFAKAVVHLMQKTGSKFRTKQELLNLEFSLFFTEMLIEYSFQDTFSTW